MSALSLTARPSSSPAPPLDLPIHHLDLVNTVHLSCTLALIDDPRCQPPTVTHSASLVPRSKLWYPSFTAPSPLARTRLTFTFAADHRLQALHLRTTNQETCCTTQLMPRLVHKLNLKRNSLTITHHNIEPQGHISTLCSQPLREEPSGEERGAEEETWRIGEARSGEGRGAGGETERKSHQCRGEVRAKK